MNKLQKTLIILGIFFLSNVSFSQISDMNQLEADAGNAVISDSYCLTLDINAPLSEVYMADISHLGFTSETEAQKVFGMKSNNRVSYMVDFDDQRVFIRIYNDRIPQGEVGTVEWWNNYLLEVCAQYK